MTSPKDSITRPSAMTCRYKPIQTPRQGKHTAARLLWKEIPVIMDYVLRQSARLGRPTGTRFP